MALKNSFLWKKCALEYIAYYTEKKLKNIIFWTKAAILEEKNCQGDSVTLSLETKTENYVEQDSKIELWKIWK